MIQILIAYGTWLDWFWFLLKWAVMIGLAVLVWVATMERSWSFRGWNPENYNVRRNRKTGRRLR